MEYYPPIPRGSITLQTDGNLFLGILQDITSLHVVLDGAGATTLQMSTLVNSVTSLTIDSVTLNTLELTNSPALASVTFETSAPLSSVTATGLALPVAAVDAIIAACVTGGHPGGVLNISGGTSAAPSGASTANLATLAGDGWTVTTN